jgi:uncharacterized metal-binding protein
MVYREVLWLGCVVCGDTSDFIAVEVHDTEQELMCARCGQARLVPILDAGTQSRSA